MKMVLGRLIILAAVLLLWQLSSGTIIDSFFISKPTEIFFRLYQWTISGELFHHLAITMEETVLGFIIGAIAGGIVGFILGRMKTLADICEPYIMAIYSLPKVALAPLFILWFGIEIQMKIVLAAVIVFFLVFFNTFAGVRNVDQELIDVIRLMGASERHLLQKVVLPSALTWIFVGLKISVPYALIGAIVGEVVASNRGIGYLIQYSSSRFDTAGVFAGLFVLMIVSTLLNSLIEFYERKFMRWKNVQQ
ncbi:MAG: ABC transporter permease [Bacillus thermozeamaize]|uniref:ABC transporter permease n=1 Tax=Bacillus thermozeamaize TaxID=230954 RepID=A0A1Y3PSS3_9BACI|nr:MAG: ABC transporter permease [Bacillus thermozeamaize]